MKLWDSIAKNADMSIPHCQVLRIRGASKRITKKNANFMKGTSMVRTIVKCVDMNISHCQVSQIHGVIK